jgi:nucleotide-binding universal stress UspA family protein
MISTKEMRVFCNILVAIDRSAGAEAALEEAIDLALRDGARLVLITVADPPRWRYAGLQYVPYPTDDELERAAWDVVECAERLVPHTIPVSSVARVGRPATEIVTRAQRGGHDLVVMGSSTHGAVGRLLFGAVSCAVVKRSPVPVLVSGRGREESPHQAGAPAPRSPGRGHSAPTAPVRAERATLGEAALSLWLVVALLLELQLLLWMFDRTHGS